MNQKKLIKNQNKSIDIKNILDNLFNNNLTMVKIINTYNQSNKYLVMVEDNIYKKLTHKLKNEIQYFINQNIQQESKIIFETFLWDELE